MEGITMKIIFSIKKYSDTYMVLIYAKNMLIVTLIAVVVKES